MQQADAHIAAVRNVSSRLRGIVQHGGEQRGHIFAGVMALEIGRVIGDLGIAYGVRLVEGVVREIQDFLVNGLCRRLRHAVCDRAGDTARGIAVDKRLPLGDDDLFLLFGNGAAHIICLPEAVAAELAENLDDLLLIDDAAVGHGEDRLELRAEIGDALRMKLVFDETRDGVHGARAVEGDDGCEVLDGLRLHVDTHACDPGGFQLENARRLAITQHGERCGVAVRQTLEIKVRLAAADGAGGVVEDRQIAQAEKVHFEQAKLLDGRHGKSLKRKS